MTLPSTLVTATELDTKGDLVSVVRSAVHRHIRDEGLLIGDVLPSEKEFAETCGVSRVVVREAFRSLSAIGVINVGAGRRARVAGIDSSMLATVMDHAVHVQQMSIQQIYDVRRTLEARTASLAAIRATKTESDAIELHARAMRADFADAQAVMEHDIAFHAAIAAAAKNPAFILIIGSFETVMRSTWPISWKSRRSDAQRLGSIEAHEAIARAIAVGEPSRAEREMQLHFDHSIGALIEAGVL